MSHITLITRNSTIDEWRIQTNLLANDINNLESGDYTKSSGDLIISGDAKLIITSNASPSLLVSNNALFSNNLTVTGNLTVGNNLIVSANINASRLTITDNIVANNITANNLLTTKTLNVTGNTKSVTYQETKAVISTSVIDLSTANYFTKTITAPTTFSVSNVPPSGTVASFILDLTNGGSNTVTWWTGTQWPNGLTPTLTSSGRDVLGFFTHDGGTTWSGFVLGKDVKAP